MLLTCNPDIAAAYHGRSQIVRVVTEDWCARELYCPGCDSDRLLQAPPNTPAVDFRCPQCEQAFQLKSARCWNQRRLVDAGYEAMLAAIKTERTPNLLVLQYIDAWRVRNLLIIPKVFLTESVIEKRKPLGPLARRARWIGCNILLFNIPPDGKIAVVSEGVPVQVELVRKQFRKVQALQGLEPSLRGWTVDVLRVIRRLAKAEFSLGDVYTSEPEL